jgi:hypothetical protein
VKGSVPLELADEVVAVGVLVLVPVVLAELELELEVAELALGVDDGAGVVLGKVACDVDAGEVAVGVLLVNGSTYCWSPADVPVPDASALPLASSPSAASAAEQARI